MASDYSKLVDALRCKRDDCEGCDIAFLDNDEGWMCQYAAKDDDAADAIEALQADLQAEKKKTVAQIYYEEQMAWEGRCKDLMYWIADLQAQLPKRGKWKTTDAFPHRVYCSNCFKTYVPNDRWQIWVDKPGEGGLERNYCPSCGAKMEVQE